ncbi:MAG: hypothetical protein LBJ00_03125 [Planctomycetaceae bacterium]|nr:hypothetical protein [Planctomycetaceae bacterium]
MNFWDHLFYTKAVLKFPKLNTQAQQREAVVQGRSLSPYRLRYNENLFSNFAQKRVCQQFQLHHSEQLPPP